MQFKEIFKHQLLKLPKTIPLRKSYRTIISELFRDYLQLFGQIDERSVKINGLKTERAISSIITRQTQFINGLSEALETYFDGQPAKAYQTFEKTMNSRIKNFKTLQTIRKFESGESFYRIRIKDENFPLSSAEMFHIPFHLRGKVNTQRYSIPGFPSLYLSKCLYVAWEELKRPNLDRFQAVRLESTQTIDCLDLTKPNWGNDPMQLNAYRYLMIWPLIAACSVKVANPVDSFKPEYIIPQLLLQWVRNNGIIDGIIYSSTNIETKSRSLGNLYNVVLPVKDNKDEGLCATLAAKFGMTPTVSRQLLNASTSMNAYERTEEELEKIDDKIPRLEIIKGQRFYYSSSELGNLEMILDLIKTESIDPVC